MSLPRKTLNVNETFDTYETPRDFLCECRRCGRKEMARLFWNGQEYATTCNECLGIMVQAR